MRCQPAVVVGFLRYLTVDICQIYSPRGSIFVPHTCILPSPLPPPKKERIDLPFDTAIDPRRPPDRHFENVLDYFGRSRRKISGSRKDLGTEEFTENAL